MKTTTFFLMAFSLSSHGQVLLDCNLGNGPYQGYTIKQDGNDLTLTTLSERGSFSKRILPASQWRSKKLKLNTPKDDFTAVVQEKNGEWFYEIEGSGFRSIGYADCR